MAPRGTKRGSSEPAAPTPLQGALSVEGEDNEQSVLLKMLVDKLDSYDRQQRLAQAATERMLTAQAEELKSIRADFERQLIAEKQAAGEAIEAATEKFMELIRKNQVDPKTRQEVIRTAIREAKEKMVEDEARFKKALEKMPKGELVSYEAEPVRFIINAVEHVIWPGKNEDVPQAFIEAWETRKDMKAWAHTVDLGFRSRDADLSANAVQSMRGLAPIWDTEKGLIK